MPCYVKLGTPFVMLKRDIIVADCVRIPSGSGIHRITCGIGKVVPARDTHLVVHLADICGINDIAAAFALLVVHALKPFNEVCGFVLVRARLGFASSELKG